MHFILVSAKAMSHIELIHKINDNWFTFSFFILLKLVPHIRRKMSVTQIQEIAASILSDPKPENSD